MIPSSTIESVERLPRRDLVDLLGRIAQRLALDEPGSDDAPTDGEAAA